MGKSYSPLRYPGGKLKFYNNMISILSNNNITNVTYCEPYSGGAGLAFALLFNNKVSKLVLNDFDRSIFAFWYSVLNYTEEFCTKILNTAITIEEWHIQKNVQLNKENASLFDLGFSTFFLNRTNRSGIIKAGPIGGYSQNSKYKIDCRFNKTRLISLIRNIAERKENIELTNLDAIDLIDLLKDRSDDPFIFFDPPYYNKGKDLYVNFYAHADHVTLSQAIHNHLKNFKWIITYDNCQQIEDIYKSFNKDSYKLIYTAGKTREATELLYYNNLKLPSL